MSTQSILNGLLAALQSSRSERSNPRTKPPPSRLTEGNFENLNDIFTKERRELMHRQLDQVTTTNKGIVFSTNFDPHEACDVHEKNLESELIFLLLFLTMRTTLLGCAFSSKGTKTIVNLALLPALVKPKSIHKLHSRLESLHSVILTILQLKHYDISLDAPFKHLKDDEIPPLPEHYKGRLMPKHYFAIHRELDRMIQWSTDSLVVKKNMHAASKSIGSLFWKMISRAMYSHVAGDGEMWCTFITASKKGTLVIHQKDDNQAISNYAFLRALFMADKNHYCTSIGEKGKPIVQQQ